MIKAFLTECDERLKRIGKALLDLESGELRDPGQISAMWASAQVIRCGARHFGLVELAQLGRVVESLLEALRDDPSQFDERFATGLRDGLGAMIRFCHHGLFGAGDEKEPEEGEVREITRNLDPLIRRLQRILCKERTTELPELELIRLNSGEVEAGIQAELEEELRSEAPELPPLGSLLVSRSQASVADIRSALRAQAQGDVRKLGEILVANGVVSAAEVLEALDEQSEVRESRGSGLVKVDISLLDRLMNLVGELVLARNQIQQHTSNYQEAGFVNTSQRLSLITSELQENVMKTRLLPVWTIWKNMPRLVRQLNSLGKKRVRVRMIGRDTEIDKSVVEALREPLMRLVKCSAEFGIESPRSRRGVLKPEVGTITLRASHEGGKVVIEVKDDGRGIDPQRCREQAVQAGILSQGAAAALSDSDALAMLFAPGYFRVDAPYARSFEKVGFDSIRAEIERIGGSTEIESRFGHFTLIRFKIPLSLAIIPALIVNADHRPFAIPQRNLIELVRLNTEQLRSQVEYIHGAPVCRLRGQLLPLVDLSTALGYPADESVDEVTIVVLQAETCRYGLVVERILDTAEIVVKPLAKQMKRITALAGATILGDGTIALIVDVQGMTNHVGIFDRAGTHQNKLPSAEINRPESELVRLLLFGVGPSRRLAVPLDTIARLEEIEAHRIEDAGGYHVLQYRGFLLPIIDLRDYLGVRAAEEDSVARILVYENNRVVVGFRVDHILDVIDARLDIDDSFGSSGVLGSTILGGDTTEVLDAWSIIRQSKLGTSADPNESQRVSA